MRGETIQLPDWKPRSQSWPIAKSRTPLDGTKKSFHLPVKPCPQERNACKVHVHDGIKENDMQMLSSRPQLNNRPAAPLYSLPALVVLSLGNGRRESLDVS